MKNSDKPAFPADAWADGCEGLTKREYFAAMAMQGIFANPNQRMCDAEPRQISEWSIIAADDLIYTLEK